jgi:hypothetical protein
LCFQDETDDGRAITKLDFEAVKYLIGQPEQCLTDVVISADLSQVPASPVVKLIQLLYEAIKTSKSPHHAAYAHLLCEFIQQIVHVYCSIDSNGEATVLQLMQAVLNSTKGYGIGSGDVDPIASSVLIRIITAFLVHADKSWTIFRTTSFDTVLSSVSDYCFRLMRHQLLIDQQWNQAAMSEVDLQSVAHFFSIVLNKVCFSSHSRHTTVP